MTDFQNLLGLEVAVCVFQGPGVERTGGKRPKRWHSFQHFELKESAGWVPG